MGAAASGSRKQRRYRVEIVKVKVRYNSKTASFTPRKRALESSKYIQIDGGDSHIHFSVDRKSLESSMAA